MLMPGKVRLNKFLRECQLGSRRKCEKYVEQGLVTINGEPVSEVGVLVDPENDEVRVDGKKVTPETKKVYVVANKPRGVVVTASDPEGRRTVYEAMTGLPAGVFSVGRLDMDSEGLLLLTNDGALAHRLLHPRFEIERVYVVGVEGKVGSELADRLTAGIELEDGAHIAREVKVLDETGRGAVLEITLTEGKKREIRRMLAACGLEVTSLKRIRFAAVGIGDLEPGQWRDLTRDEVRALRHMVEEAYLARRKGA
jgi:23S rRNA pseudouridine2605 synthase